MTKNAANSADDIRFDRFLRFDAHTDAQHEIDNGAARVKDLQRNILIGLLFYNVYNLTSIVLMPDIFWLTVLIRLGVVTVGSLLLVWMVPKLGPHLREWIVAAGLLNAMIFPIGFFWLTQAPLGTYTFGELSLTVFYGNMLLVLRFAPALIFNTLTIAAVVVAVLTKADLTGAMMFAFLVQFITAVTFAGIGNYLVERRRCIDYVVALRATLRAEVAETSSIALHQMSQTDALTGLPNRRYLDERLADWFQSSGDVDVAIIMIDIDHFKLFNDTLGHPAGDDCLRQIAEAFAQFVSGPNVFCARFGGEEFTVVLRKTPQLEVARMAQSLQRAIVELDIRHPGRNDGVDVVTISLGISHRGQNDSLQDVLARADVALYAAKRRGRNQFVISDDRMDNRIDDAG